MIFGFRIVTTGETTTKQKEDTTTEKKPVVNPRDENLPSWLNPTFNRESPKSSDETGDDDPSWLIPAYQKAASSTSSVHAAVRDLYRAGVVLVLSVVWMGVQLL